MKKHLTTLLCASACMWTLCGCAVLQPGDKRPVSIGVISGAYDEAAQRALSEAWAARQVRLVMNVDGGDGWVGSFAPANLPAPSSMHPAMTRHESAWGYSIDYGPLHIAVLERKEPPAPKSEAWQWLLEDLSLTDRPWKVVFMPAPIVTPSAGQSPAGRVDRSRLDLAELFAQQHVTLAVAAQPGGYFRSMRIGPSQDASVHYMLLGSAVQETASYPLWTARAASEPTYVVIEAKSRRFRCAAYDLGGKLIDLLELKARHYAGPSRFFTFGELLAGEVYPEENRELSLP